MFDHILADPRLAKELYDARLRDAERYQRGRRRGSKPVASPPSALLAIIVGALGR